MCIGDAMFTAVGDVAHVGVKAANEPHFHSCDLNQAADG
jgi:hypothetical protein